MLHELSAVLSRISVTRERHVGGEDHSHKWVIDRDDKDSAGILELIAIDVAGDMSSRARRA